MKYLFINSVAGYGSTGKLVEKEARKLMGEGHECAIAYGRTLVNCDGIAKYQIGNKLTVAINGVVARVFDNEGFGLKGTTRKLIRWIDEYKPDVIWLHNLHGYYINVQLLFEYIKAHPDIEVKWTLHDCWTFTGHCAHYMTIDCEQWQDQCRNCELLKDYPKCIGRGNVAVNYARKKAAFTGISKMELIVPCQWLADEVAKSYLKEYKTKVVYNTIDEAIFKPTESDFKEKFAKGKKLILGVANDWSDLKGLKDFIELDRRLDSDKYKVVLVGLTEKQLRDIPESILGIKRTNSAKELAEIYTAADVYLNLTYWDNYPTTNLEAQACGTPCITYRTGGSPESVPKENVVEVGDLEAVVEKIKAII